jgi:hypothetical protein
MLPDFLMQWVTPDVVLASIATAQSARCGTDETPKVVPITHATRSI